MGLLQIVVGPRKYDERVARKGRRDAPLAGRGGAQGASGRASGRSISRRALNQKLKKPPHFSASSGASLD